MPEPTPYKVYVDAFVKATIATFETMVGMEAVPGEWSQRPLERPRLSALRAAAFRVRV
jgi:hypothetical protein